MRQSRGHIPPSFLSYKWRSPHSSHETALKMESRNIAGASPCHQWDSLESCCQSPSPAVAHTPLDVPALHLRELSRIWRVTTSPRGLPMATTQSSCPFPRMSMVPVGSRYCLPQAPTKEKRSEVTRTEQGWNPELAGAEKGAICYSICHHPRH